MDKVELKIERSLKSGEVFGREMLFTHSYLTSVFLPLRKPADGVRAISRSSGRVSMELVAGSLPDRETGHFVPVPLPYGSKARLVLINLCSRAVKAQSPEVHLEASFTAFARELGHSVDQRAMNRLKEQMRRMSVLTMRLAKKNGDSQDVFNAVLFERFKATYAKNPDQQLLFPDTVEFSSKFHQSLMKHAVPISKDQLSAIQDSGLAIDILLWLSARLPRTLHPVKISWSSLHWAFSEFGTDRKSFKRRFKHALNRVLDEAYREANVEVVHGGIVIKNSKPPIPFKWRRTEGLIVG